MSALAEVQGIHGGQTRLSPQEVPVRISITHEYAASNGERDFFSDVIQLRILTGEIILNVSDGPNLIT